MQDYKAIHSPEKAFTQLQNLAVEDHLAAGTSTACWRKRFLLKSVAGKRLDEETFIANRVFCR
jgi:hypothetical protein